MEVRAAYPVEAVRPAGRRRLRRGWLIAVSLLCGLGIAIVWWARLTDDYIGVNAANGILGHNSLTAGIGSSLAGIFFAFVTGLVGTFTACNVAVFSAVAPLMGEGPSIAARARAALRPLGCLLAGALMVAASYGAIGGAFGRDIPQLSTALIGGHTPVRVLQSVVVFGVLGLAFVYLGLGAVGLVPNPLGRLAARWPYAPQLVMGALIGAFLIGRPYPLFFRMFQYAAAHHNAAYGALTFALVVIGNIVLMSILFLALSVSPFSRWLGSRPGRAHRFTAAAFLVGGAFLFFYWGVRVPASFGYGWFPTLPWT